jgi:hypothetical protein
VVVGFGGLRVERASGGWFRRVVAVSRCLQVD